MESTRAKDQARALREEPLKNGPDTTESLNPASHGRRKQGLKSYFMHQEEEKKNGQ